MWKSDRIVENTEANDVETKSAYETRINLIFNDIKCFDRDKTCKLFNEFSKVWQK